MTDTKKTDRGWLRIDVDECKGCGLCIEACPPKAIRMSEGMNHYGYRTAVYAGSGCTGCAICFLVCPEPGAITVFRAAQRQSGGARAINSAFEGSASGGMASGGMASGEAAPCAGS